jgi:hypothetical protein
MTRGLINNSRPQQLAKHYQRIAALWPKDPVRPERLFTKVTEFREKRLADLSQTELQGELRNVNALYSLLDDRYSKKVCGFFFLHISLLGS